MENKIAEYITMTYEEIICIAEEASGYNDLYLVDTYGVWINSKNTKRTIEEMITGEIRVKNERCGYV